MIFSTEEELPIEECSLVTSSKEQFQEEKLTFPQDLNIIS